MPWPVQPRAERYPRRGRALLGGGIAAEQRPCQPASLVGQLGEGGVEVPVPHDQLARLLDRSEQRRLELLVVSNPGGLYGITVDRLGQDAVTSARNARLVAICQHVRSPQTGARVIEALASGIPTITEALAEHHLPPAHYIDSGIRFTVVLHQPTTTVSLSPG